MIRADSHGLDTPSRCATSAFEYPLASICPAVRARSWRFSGSSVRSISEPSGGDTEEVAVLVVARSGELAEGPLLSLASVPVAPVVDEVPAQLAEEPGPELERARVRGVIAAPIVFRGEDDDLAEQKGEALVVVDRLEPRRAAAGGAAAEDAAAQFLDVLNEDAPALVADRQRRVQHSLDAA